MWLVRGQTLASSGQKEVRASHRAQQMNTPWRYLRNGGRMLMSDDGIRKPSYRGGRIVATRTP